ncbi:MAG: TIGR01459 family HAD-type hydrolase [Hyphomicrobium sp.]|nr:MAG: TIGR01459 family HAD-type hydrolase [Hyphomicrobium sp.]PPD01646.1 MAG: TIGR01459 family HAD-type hydrolase [Hyphomicrobium sp.]
MIDIPEINSIEPLAATSDVWFLDIWGVLHNGRKPFDSAVAACQKFRQSGGTVVLVSNSPRPRAGVIRQLTDIGVDAHAYDAVVTSGDVSRDLIAAWSGRSVRHIGPQRDVPIFNGLNVRCVGVERAEGIVCTGLYDDDTESPDDYAGELSALHARDLQMICANPDIKVERGGRIIFCAGSIAAAYEALGGRVLYAGKPYAPIYEMACQIVENIRGKSVDRKRLLAIGDGVHTDIKGAAQFGIRSVFVASGVHVEVHETLAEAARRHFVAPQEKPVVVMRALAW